MSVGFLPSVLRGVTLTTSGRLPDGHLRVSGSTDTDGLLVGLDDRDDAFLVSGIGLAGVLRRDLVDDFPRGVALEPFGDPAADDFTSEAAPGRRELNFTAMGGAYNRVPTDATAFVHRSERFLLEHVAHDGDQWLDRSWVLAHALASGRFYPNFPDPDLDDWATAHHGGNAERLRAVKRSYDPERLFRFPQAI
jgi:hypothetical protein